jgi:hypothetical protein
MMSATSLGFSQGFAVEMVVFGRLGKVVDPSGRPMAIFNLSMPSSVFFLWQLLLVQFWSLITCGYTASFKHGIPSGHSRQDGDI